MPSTQNPVGLVNPGPGKTLPGQVIVGSIGGGGGGGGSGDLLAHIQDPLDAHFASAIGVEPTHLPTGTPVLSEVGGPFDGESVLDVLSQLSFLAPLPPDRLGFDSPFVQNSGIPDWGALDSALTGGYDSGGNVIFTKSITASGILGMTVRPLVYPADRGVLCLYSNAGGDFTDGTSTLVAALWLGSTASKPGALTIASANFQEANRNVGQGFGPTYSYTPSMVGTDIITLNYRLPVLSDYSGYPGSNYTNFPQTFPTFQLAKAAIFQTLSAAGANGSFLLVHWRASYALSDATISGASLLPGNLVQGNCYSAVPAIPGDWDTGNVANVAKRHIFRDVNSGVAPSLALFTSSLANIPSIKTVSGVGYMDDLIGPTLNLDIQVNDLADSSFNTDATPDGVNTPLGYGSVKDPLTLDYSGLGVVTTVPKSYNQLRQAGAGITYGPANAPAPGDVVQYVALADSPGALGVICTDSGAIKAKLNKPYQPEVEVTDSTLYLVNTIPNPPSVLNTTTETLETFTGEFYRYADIPVSIAPSILDMPPAGLDIYPSVTALVTGDNYLQVAAGALVYPQTDYTGAQPAGPDYSTIPGTDAIAVPAGYVRRYMRAFNTGQPINRGKVRIKGIAPSAFAAIPAYTANEILDHPGGVIVQLYCIHPAFNTSTLVCDLGRPKGLPSTESLNNIGCLVGKTGSGVDWTYAFELPWFTWQAPSGKCPLVVRISYINGPGTSAVIEEIEYLPLV